MAMSDYEKLIWEEIREMRSDLKTIRQYMEEEISDIKDDVNNIKTSQAISKTKLGAIISTISIIASAIVSIIVKKVV